VRPGKPVEEARKGLVKLNAGDQMHILSGGGGGYGDPLERDITRVERDVRLGYVTREAALDVYGVVLDEAGCALEAQTLAARIRLARRQE
jgi:N-methylhydantoinase B